MFLFLMKLLDRNSLVFGNKEECICLFVSIRKICQRRKYNDQFTFLAFLDLSKKKKKKLLIQFQFMIYLKILLILVFVVNAFSQFIISQYLISKARAKFNSKLFQKKFLIYHGVRQECLFSPILFNIFIIGIFDKCKRYSVISEKKKVLWWLVC